MKEKILLHVCCAPCSTTALERLCENYNVVAFWYNPNIQPDKEYEKRKETFLNYAKKMGVELEILEGKKEKLKWGETVKGLENEPEGGKRCEKCYSLRLQQTKKTAKELGIKLFTTTLSVSPHKDSLKIFEIAKELENEEVRFLPENFKKKDGYKRSIELSKSSNLYRQTYCGCLYSRRPKEVKNS